MNIKVLSLEVVKERAIRYEIEDNQITNPNVAKDIFNTIGRLNRASGEKVDIIALDTKNKPVGYFNISVGTINSSPLSPREIFQKLLAVNASGFIMAHNHPSGNITPSLEDISATKRIKECGQLMSISLLDHLIIGGNSDDFYSFANDGNL